MEGAVEPQNENRYDSRPLSRGFVGLFFVT